MENGTRATRRQSVKVISHIYYMYCAYDIMPSCHGKEKGETRGAVAFKKKTIVHSNPVKAGK